jgi:hypothetical protein
VHLWVDSLAQHHRQLLINANEHRLCTQVSIGSKAVFRVGGLVLVDLHAAGLIMTTVNFSSMQLNTGSAHRSALAAKQCLGLVAWFWWTFRPPVL